MTTILYMAISANGMIAKNDDDTSWISKEEWDSYSAVVRAAGILIVGHRTYGILTKQPEFAEFKEVMLIVVSSGDVALFAPNHMLAHSPKEALALAGAGGVDSSNNSNARQVIIAGGSILNASFLIEGLIDEIYLDIEPVLFASGIPVAAVGKLDLKLKLLAQKKIGENGIQLHYQVIS